MPDRATLKRHALLMDKMASAVGVDLQEAAIAGRISIDEITDSLLRCTGCSDPEFCEAWLADHATGAAETPGFCRNRDVLRSLLGWERTE